MHLIHGDGIGLTGVETHVADSSAGTGRGIGCPVIRVAIVAPHPLTRAGFHAALSGAEVAVVDETGELSLADVDAVMIDASTLSGWRAVRATSGMTAPPRECAWREPRGRIALLSVREREVLGLIGDGLSNHAIAVRLRLAERTIKAHVGRVLTKLGVESRLQAGLVAMAQRVDT
jgi:DNA-binding NarL/FixJ family response regulator